MNQEDEARCVKDHIKEVENVTLKKAINARDSHRIHRISLAFILFFFAGACLLPFAAGAQDSENLSAANLKKLSLEDLLNLEVTSVSRKEEKLSEVASAIQVITREDIRRSAATSIPEALRLATNLQVAQINANAWIISARGFNGAFSNKLLVMIDGRTVYSPLFAGVFWDVQSVLLEDIERIEIISGPGGTLWGANAVNGVINIITRNADTSTGTYVSAGTGSFLRDYEAIRYGGKIGSDITYRVYAQHHHRNNTFTPAGEDFSDAWYLTQAGFRLDWSPSEKNTTMFQGNAYAGTQYTAPEPSPMDGQNVMGRWQHVFSEASDLILQGYYDRTWRRDIPSTFSDELNTYDIDLQHRFPLGKRQSILWGGGYRRMNNHILHSTAFAGFLPPKRNMDLFSAFIQDEIAIVPARLNFTLGTKLQHNDFSGFEFQPSARVAWTPNKAHTLWSAVSRAIRAPSRIDVNLFIPTFDVPPGTPHVAGGPDFTSEKVVAYELGYRVNPAANISMSLTAFFNRYDDLYSVEAQDDGTTYQIENGTKGDSHGLEFSGTFQVLKAWRLRSGYTYFKKSLEGKPGHDLAASNYDPETLGYDARDNILLQSVVDLPLGLQFDVTARYLTKLGTIAPDYFSFDARLACVYHKWEVAVVGQNLWEDRHKEFLQEIPRSVYGKITCRL